MIAQDVTVKHNGNISAVSKAKCNTVMELQ